MLDSSAKWGIFDPETTLEATDSDLASKSKCFMARGLRRAEERIFNETFNDFHSRPLSGNAWPLHASCSDARENQQPYPYKMTTQDMTQRYRKFKGT